jgi:hypothetical protein
VVEAAQDLAVGPEAQVGKIEEGEQVAMADVEEEVVGAAVVAVLEGKPRMSW